MQSRRKFLAGSLTFSLGAAAGASLLSTMPGSYAVASSAPGTARDNTREAAASPAATVEKMALPQPDTKRGKPLMEALLLRKSARKFKELGIPVQDLSNLLWASFGINRPDGKRTIPTAMNKQNLIVYAAMETGIWRYVPESHHLSKEAHINLCALLGGAPVTLAYAAQDAFGCMHVGSAYQNVGLYCASAGFGNVVKATGLDIMKKYLSVPPGYELLILQSVGRTA